MTIRRLPTTPGAGHGLVVIFTMALVGLLPRTDLAGAAEGSKAEKHQGRGHQGAQHQEHKTAPGAESTPLEVQFLDTMIAHHQAAVDMARLIKARSAHPELVEMGSAIQVAQRREIDQLRAWRQRWYKTQPSGVNMALPGMEDSMDGMDMEKLKRARGKDFDLLLLEMMIPHHEGAVRMSQWIQEQTTRRELKELADRIIRQQQREIESMKQWKASWAESRQPAEGERSGSHSADLDRRHPT
jgi:uncharacterized protein (DUF305 family)